MLPTHLVLVVDTCNEQLNHEVLLVLIEEPCVLIGRRVVEEEIIDKTLPILNLLNLGSERLDCRRSAGGDDLPLRGEEYVGPGWSCCRVLAGLIERR
jgi:hypothetical protein